MKCTSRREIPNESGLYLRAPWRQSVGMNVRKTQMDGVLLVQRAVCADERGTFEVVWNAAECAKLGIPTNFAQDNLIVTRRGVLRGMHYQSRLPQGKLLTVLEGEVYDAAVDMRPDSPTFGKAWGAVLRASDHESLWLPPGFAHGFEALSERVVYLYKVTQPWDPERAHVLAWNDPHTAIPWPLVAGQAPILSEKDREGRSWADVSREMSQHC